MKSIQIHLAVQIQMGRSPGKGKSTLADMIAKEIGAILLDFYVFGSKVK